MSIVIVIILISEANKRYTLPKLY